MHVVANAQNLHSYPFPVPPFQRDTFRAEFSR
jgi:hypothetical protein